MIYTNLLPNQYEVFSVRSSVGIRSDHIKSLCGNSYLPTSYIHILYCFERVFMYKYTP